MTSIYTQKDKNIIKKRFSIIILFIVLVILGLLSYNFTYKKSIESNNIKIISEDFTKSIKSYQNNILGVSFGYPADLGAFSFKEDSGFSGSSFVLSAKNEINNRSIIISGFSQDYNSDDILPINMSDYKKLDIVRRLKLNDKNELLLPVLDDHDTSQTKGIFRLSFGEMQAVNAVSVRVQYLTSLKNPKYKSAVFEFQGFTNLELEQFAHSIKIN